MGFVNLKEKMYVKELCLNQKPPLVEKGATWSRWGAGKGVWLSSSGERPKKAQEKR